MGRIRFDGPQHKHITIGGLGSLECFVLLEAAGAHQVAFFPLEVFNACHMARQLELGSEMATPALQ